MDWVLVHMFIQEQLIQFTAERSNRCNSATEFEVNAGVTTVPTFYQSGGTAQPALIAPRVNNNSASGFDPASQGSSVLRSLIIPLLK